jgi:hypothetical protein
LTTTTEIDPTAPVFVSAAGDLKASTVAVTFDRPVQPGGGGSGLIPMYLVIYGSDQTCATPAGNGHTYLAGAGTPTITMGQVTSLTPTTTYITIASGLVTGVGNRRANRSQPCTAIPISS